MGISEDPISISFLCAVVTILFLARWYLSVPMDPREPPLVKPKIPYIGHILGLVRAQDAYLQVVSKRPIYTLPMAMSKIYVITDVSLIQNAFRSSALTIEPYMADFGQAMLALEDGAMTHIRAIPENPKDPSFMRDTVREMNGAMTGPELHKMNAQALNNMALTINDIDVGKGLETENLYYWLRNAMTMATSIALFGSHSPTIADPSLVDAVWDFDAGTMGLLVRIFPSCIGSKGYNARVAWKSALRKYYNAKHDLEPDVAQLTKTRANVAKRYNVSLDHIGDLELSLIHVSTANAIPTLFWGLVYITSNVKLTEEIRQELQDVIKPGPGAGLPAEKREMLIDITKFEASCPLLVSVYRETIRLANAQIGVRRVLRDTVISDGQGGQEYLLTKGADVMMPSGITHVSNDIWGADAHKFDPRRFLTNHENASERKRAYFPFGGGKHLCPGRNFAFAEILGTISVLLLGFDVKNSEGGPFKVPARRRAKIGAAVGLPQANEKMGARIERRKGWEDVVWKFVC